METGCLLAPSVSKTLWCSEAGRKRESDVSCEQSYRPILRGMVSRQTHARWSPDVDQNCVFAFRSRSSADFLH
jgi:hypothetical protein